MIEIISIEKVKKGDTLLLDVSDRAELITVEKTDSGLIIPVEWGGMDYSPENPDEIIRIGTKKNRPTIIVLAKNISLGLSKFWEDKWQKLF